MSAAQVSTTSLRGHTSGQRATPRPVTESSPLRDAAQDRQRIPLIVGATKGATDSGRKLGVRGVLENRVAERWMTGHVRDLDRDDRTKTIRVDEGRDDGRMIVAVAQRTASPLTGRKAWRITNVRVHR